MSNCLPGSHSCSSPTMGFPEIKMNMLFHSPGSETTGGNHTPRVDRKIRRREQNDTALIRKPGAKQRQEGSRGESSSDSDGTWWHRTQEGQKGGGPAT